MVENFAPVNGIDICYETFGDANSQPLLLVHGIHGQMISWNETFCEQLAGRGFYVIRFDNRDSGRSTKLTEPKSPVRVALRLQRPAYLLRDLAADAIGLLDHLNVSAAHVMGMSMGGMIAQTIAIEYPGRVRSLTSIMSTTGNLCAGYPRKPAAVSYVIQRFPADRDANTTRLTKMLCTLSSPGFPLDESALHEFAARSVARGTSPDGALRQAAAVFAASDRTKDLGRLTIPAFVVHGLSDPLIDVSGGRATAAAILGAELFLIPGMGHDLPPQTWVDLVDGFVRTAGRRELSK
ncbi:alpha/beta fold hydrolase [Nocardia sp. NBC_00565]|uniref:alpha/beta fold hydrolase n=1 Tax=Nocardia sp. NBC_00565 TaxID=2975993 RepID=UPI002E80099C|nr:alpha/beta hydrolase [Nocardia sp. NBC_00565]WUC03419.1 alpha/beta fold hydrolase [Nocardia sp. NBC_00565]